MRMLGLPLRAAANHRSRYSCITALLPFDWHQTTE